MQLLRTKSARADRRARSTDTWIWILMFSVGSGIACAQKPASKDMPAGQSTKTAAAAKEAGQTEDQLIGALRSSFQKKNPKLGQVGVLDLKAWDLLGPRLVLGWAIVSDHQFRGDFNDEMFGVFVVSESLIRLERTVDIFPTERWFDYDVRFGRFTADSVEVLGRGATYSDGPTRRLYKWR